MFGGGIIPNGKLHPVVEILIGKIDLEGPKPEIKPGAKLSLWTPLLVAIGLKIDELRQRAEGRWKCLPENLIAAAQPFYKADLKKVRYVDTIGTCLVKDTATTFEYEIFFPGPIDPLKKDLRWMLHELLHVDQFIRLGGLGPFLEKYCADALDKAISHFTLNPHDYMEAEKEANQHADAHHDEILRKLEK